MYVAKPFALEPADRPAKLAGLVADDMLAESAIGAAGVAIATEPLRHVEHEDDGQAVILACQSNERLPRLNLDVRRVNDSEFAGAEPLARDELQNLKGVLGGGLTVLVVRHESATVVRRENFCRLEVLACKRGLARAGSPDQYDECELWNPDFHRQPTRKIAICVGGPSARSTGPTGAKLTS